MDVGPRLQRRSRVGGASRRREHAQGRPRPRAHASDARAPTAPGVRLAVPDHNGHRARLRRATRGDRKSTRLNSSHSQISYAVFCLKKKKKIKNTTTHVKHK